MMRRDSSSYASSQTSVSRSTFASNIAPFAVTTSPMPPQQRFINSNQQQTGGGAGGGLADAVRQVFGASMSPQQNQNQNQTITNSSSALYQQSQLDPSSFLSPQARRPVLGTGNTRNNDAVENARSTKTHIRHNLPTAKSSGDPFARINQHDHLFEGTRVPALNQNSVPHDRDLWNKSNSPERNAELFKLHHHLSVQRSSSPVQSLMTGASYRHTKASLQRMFQNMNEEEDDKGKNSSSKKKKTVTLAIPGMQQGVKIHDRSSALMNQVNNNPSLLSSIDNSSGLLLSGSLNHNNSNFATSPTSFARQKQQQQSNNNNEDFMLSPQTPIPPALAENNNNKENTNTNTNNPVMSSSLLQSSGIKLHKGGLDHLAELKTNQEKQQAAKTAASFSSASATTALPELQRVDTATPMTTGNRSTQQNNAAENNNASPISLEDLANVALDRLGSARLTARRNGESLMNNRTSPLRAMMNVKELINQTSARNTSNNYQNRSSARYNNPNQSVFAVDNQQQQISSARASTATPRSRTATPRGLKVLEKLQQQQNYTNSAAADSDYSHLLSNMTMTERNLREQVHPITSYADLHKNMDKIYQNGTGTTSARNYHRTSTPSRSSTPTRRQHQQNQNQNQEKAISLSALNSAANLDRELSEFEKSLQVKRQDENFMLMNSSTHQAVNAASQLFVRTIGSDDHEASMTAMVDGSKNCSKNKTNNNNNNNKRTQSITELLNNSQHLSQNDISRFHQRKSAHMEFVELYHQCEELWALVGTGIQSRERATTAFFPMLFGGGAGGAKQSTGTFSTTQLASFRQTITKYLKKLQTQHDLTEAANNAMIARDSTIFDIVAISKRYSEYCRHSLDAAESWRQTSSKQGVHIGSAKRFEETNSVAMEANAIKHELRVALHKYRVCTLFAIEAIASWMEFTGRVDYWWRGRPALISICTDLHQAAFSRRPLLYLLGFDVVHNPFVLPSEKWYVIPRRERRMMMNNSNTDQKSSQNQQQYLSGAARHQSISISDPRRKDGEAQNFVLVNEYGIPLQHEKAEILSSTRASLLSQQHQQSTRTGSTSQKRWSQSPSMSLETINSQHQNQQQKGSRAWSSSSNPNTTAGSLSSSQSTVSPFWKQMETDEYEYKTRMESALHLLRHAVLQCIVPIQSSIRGFLARKHFRREYILVRILQNHLRAFVRKLEIDRARRLIAARELFRCYSGYRVRFNFGKKRRAIIRLQSWFRGTSIRSLLKQQSEAATQIAKWVRPLVRRSNQQKKKLRQICLLQRVGRSYLNRVKLCDWAWSRISAKRRSIAQILLVEREVRFEIEKKYLSTCVFFGGGISASSLSSQIWSQSSGYFTSLLRKDELDSLPANLHPQLSPLAMWAQVTLFQMHSEFTPVLARISILSNYEQQVFDREQLMMEERNERSIVLGSRKKVIERMRMVEGFFSERKHLIENELEPLARKFIADQWLYEIREIALDYEDSTRLSELQKLEKMRRSFILQSEIDERFSNDISPYSTYPKCELLEKEERRRIMGVAAGTFAFEFLTMVSDFESLKRRAILEKWKKVVGFFSSSSSSSRNKNNNQHDHLQQNVFSTIMSPGQRSRSNENDDFFHSPSSSSNVKIAFQIEQLHLSSQEEIARDRLQKQLFSTENPIWTFWEGYARLLKNMNRQLNILFDSEAYAWVKLMSWDGISNFRIDQTPQKHRQKELEKFDMPTPDLKPQKSLGVLVSASTNNNNQQQEQPCTPVNQQTVRWNSSQQQQQQQQPVAALHLLASISSPEILQKQPSPDTNNDQNQFFTQFTEVSLASANPVLFRALIMHATRLQRIGRAFITRKGFLNLLHQESQNRKSIASSSIRELFPLIEEVTRNKILISECSDRNKRTTQIRLALGLVDALCVKKANYRLKRLATKVFILPALASSYNKSLQPQLDREQRNFFETESRHRDHIIHSEETSERSHIVHQCLISAEQSMTATIRRRWTEHEDLVREARQSEENHERRERVLQDRIYDLLMKNEQDQNDSRSEANRQLAKEIAETERMKEQMWGRVRTEQYYAEEEKKLLVAERDQRRNIVNEEESDRNDIGRESAQTVFLSVCSPPRGVLLPSGLIREGSRSGIVPSHSQNDPSSILSPEIRSYNRFLAAAEEQKLLSPETLAELRPRFNAVPQRGREERQNHFASSPQPLTSPPPPHQQNNFDETKDAQVQSKLVHQADEDFSNINRVQFESVAEWNQKPTANNNSNLILNMTPIQKREAREKEEGAENGNNNIDHHHQPSFLSTNLSALSPTSVLRQNQQQQQNDVSKTSSTHSFSPNSMARGRHHQNHLDEQHENNNEGDDDFFGVLDEIGNDVLPTSPPRENDDKASSPGDLEIQQNQEEKSLESTQRPNDDETKRTKSESPQPEKPPLATKKVIETDDNDTDEVPDFFESEQQQQQQQVAVGSAVSLSRSRSRSVDSRGRPIVKVVKKVAVIHHHQQNEQRSESAPRNNVEDIEGFDQYNNNANTTSVDEENHNQLPTQPQQQQNFVGKPRTREVSPENEGPSYLSSASSLSMIPPTATRPLSAGRRRQQAQQFAAQQQQPQKSGGSTSNNTSLMAMFQNQQHQGTFDDNNDDDDETKIPHVAPRGVELSSGRIRPSSVERKRGRSLDSNPPRWNDNTDVSQREQYDERDPLPPVSAVTSLPGLGSLRQMMQQSQQRRQHHHQSNTSNNKSLADFIANDEISMFQQQPQNNYRVNEEIPSNAHVAARNNIDSDIPDKLSRLENFAGSVSASIHRSHQRLNTSTSRSRPQPHPQRNSQIYAEHQPKQSDYIRNDFGEQHQQRRQHHDNDHFEANNNNMSQSIPSLRQSPIRMANYTNNSTRNSPASHQNNNFQPLLRRASDIMTEQELQLLNDLSSPSQRIQHHSTKKAFSPVRSKQPTAGDHIPGNLSSSSMGSARNHEKRDSSRKHDDVQELDDSQQNDNMRSILAQYTTLTLNDNDHRNHSTNTSGGATTGTTSPSKRVKFAPGTKQHDESTLSPSRRKLKMLRDPNSPSSPSSSSSLTSPKQNTLNPHRRVLPMPNSDSRTEEAKTLQSHPTSYLTSIHSRDQLSAETRKSFQLQRASEILTPPRSEPKYDQNHSSSSPFSPNKNNTSMNQLQQQQQQQSSPASRTHHQLSPPFGVPKIIVDSKDRHSELVQDKGEYHRNRIQELIDKTVLSGKHQNNNQKGKEKTPSPPGINVHSPSPPKIVLQSPSVPNNHSSQLNETQQNNNNNSNNNSNNTSTSLLSAKYKPDLPWKEYF